MQNDIGGDLEFVAVVIAGSVHKKQEARPLLAMLSELLGHAIADRENLLPEQRP
jgi:hypothetical protein